MIYLDLFLSFLKIGLFSIGGGYAAMPLIQLQVVEQHQWLTLEQFTDLITIAEMTPGPIAVNAATFVGVNIAGPFGAVVATMGCILPSCVLASALAIIYAKYKDLATLKSVLASLRPAVVALIAGAGLMILELVAYDGAPMAWENVQLWNVCVFAVAFVVLRNSKFNPIVVMTACGVVNLCAHALLIV